MTRRLHMDDFARLATEPEMAAQRRWWGQLQAAGAVPRDARLVWVEPWAGAAPGDPTGWTWGETRGDDGAEHSTGAPVEWFTPELSAAWWRCLLAHEGIDVEIVDEPMPSPGEMIAGGASWSWRAPEAPEVAEVAEVAAMGGAAWPLPDAEWAWPPPETPRLFLDPDPDETGPHRGEYRLFYVDDAGLLVHCGYVAAEAVAEVNARLRRG